MTTPHHPVAAPLEAPLSGRPLNLSRRGFLATATTALVLSVALPTGRARAQAPAAIVAPGTRVSAFLEIRPDSTVLFRSPFIEGGQGIFTSMAQIVGEELDVDPALFTVEGAPPGADYQLVGGGRFTGGSFSVRSSYQTLRQLGASARQMLIQAAAARLEVPVDELATEPGRVIHAGSGRSVGYGELAGDAMDLPVPEDVPLRAAADFRWIGKPVARLDAHAKSTGQVQYAIDLSVEGMMHAAVQHAPRRGQQPGSLVNEADVQAMPGVDSVHSLPGAVAVVANSWWRARMAVEALQVEWTEAETEAGAVAGAGTDRPMPAGFSSGAQLDLLRGTQGDGTQAEAHGDIATGFGTAATTIEAAYDAPYLAHGQLEPPSSLARFNDDSTLELWVPNQAPEMFQAAAAQIADLSADQVIVHSPVLGGFFGRHFLYGDASPFSQAILLARAVGRPVKVLWSREEEFLRDTLRPQTVARFRAGLDDSGLPVALSAVSIGEGPVGRWYGRQDGTADSSAVEGIAGKPYAIAHRRMGQVHVDDPAVIGFWRSVGHSMNDFFYESFFDEMADAGGQDPFELRLRLLQDSPRHHSLLQAVADLSGGWQRGPFAAGDGSQRARGVAMASPFGSEVATIAEVSVEGSEIRVHDIWVAIDPGTMVNPAIIEAQVNSAVALGLSSALHERVTYRDGMPEARNFDAYPILRPDQMPRVHVRIIESGAPIGGIGEPGLPGVPPAVANAVAVLTGQRLRSLPLALEQGQG